MFDDRLITYFGITSLAGSLLGGGIGIRKIIADRTAERAAINQKSSEMITHPAAKSFVSKVAEGSYILGQVGYYSIRGMFIYTITPPILLPFVLKKDLK